MVQTCLGSSSPFLTEIMAAQAGLHFITDATILPVLRNFLGIETWFYLKDCCQAEWAVWRRMCALYCKLSAK